jgi:hypothetical protein
MEVALQLAGHTEAYNEHAARPPLRSNMLRANLFYDRAY